ncbi:MAG TPA: hypothetical protein VN698_02260 [Bacteroidia bacterium]|nr:hypothetical protein [Bacteroidia bacterium]
MVFANPHLVLVQSWACILANLADKTEFNLNSTPQMYTGLNPKLMTLVNSEIDCHHPQNKHWGVTAGYCRRAVRCKFFWVTKKSFPLQSLTQGSKTIIPLYHTLCKYFTTLY